jgi:hypothetical protein
VTSLLVSNRGGMVPVHGIANTGVNPQHHFKDISRLSFLLHGGGGGPIYC